MPINPTDFCNVEDGPEGEVDVTAWTVDGTPTVVYTTFDRNLAGERAEAIRAAFVSWFPQPPDPETVTVRPIDETCEATITFCHCALGMMLALEKANTELDDGQRAAVTKAAALLEAVSLELTDPTT